MRPLARRTLRVLAALALTAACRPQGPTPRPQPPQQPSRPAAAGSSVPDAAPVEPDLCHASVDWRDGGFEIVGLPCVRRDGAEILFARSEERPRQPDLTVVAVTRDDRLSRYVAVMEPHEGGELLDGARRPTPELRARLVKANVLLTDASRRAVPLAAYRATPAGTHAGQGLEVAWTERGRITISRDGRFVHEGDHGRWLEPLAACAAPSYLAQVWGDAARGVLLVKIASRAANGCTAPPALHVISWTP
jgi:hypothetical protein